MSGSFLMALTQKLPFQSPLETLKRSQSHSTWMHLCNGNFHIPAVCVIPTLYVMTSLPGVSSCWSLSDIAEVKPVAGAALWRWNITQKVGVHLFIFTLNTADYFI